MLAYIPYMDPMGRNVNHSNSGVFLKYWFTSLQGDAWPPPGVVEDVMKKNNLGTAFYVRFLGKFGWIHSDSILQFPSIFHPFSGSCGRLSGDNLGGRLSSGIPAGPHPGGAEQHGLLEDAGSRRAMAADSAMLCLHSMV